MGSVQKEDFSNSFSFERCPASPALLNVNIHVRSEKVCASKDHQYKITFSASFWYSLFLIWKLRNAERKTSKHIALLYLMTWLGVSWLTWKSQSRGKYYHRNVPLKIQSGVSQICLLWWCSFKEKCWCMSNISNNCYKRS